MTEIDPFEQSIARIAAHATPVLTPMPAVLNRLLFVSMIMKKAPLGQGRARILWPDSMGRINVLHLDHTYVVGRDAAAELRLDQVAVSRTHCVLRHFSDYDEIEDLCSSNGTWVNGLRITRKILRDGDVLQVGGQLLAYENPREPADFFSRVRSAQKSA